MALESLCQFAAYLFILARQQARQFLHHSYVGAVRVPNGCKLHADGAAANDHYAFRTRLLQNGLQISEYPLAIRFERCWN